MIQVEPTQGDFVLVFFLLNLALIVSYICFKTNRNSLLPWLMALVFCLFAKWETDYFTFQQSFTHGINNDYQDPIYYYLQFLSLDSYLAFRTWIWGLSLFFLYKTCIKMQVSPTIVIFVLASSFLMTFSYARATLAMTAFFYGLSILVYDRKSIINIIIILGLYLFSFFAHRSILPIILFTPLALIPFKKKYIVLMLLMIIPLQLIATNLMVHLSLGPADLGSSLSRFQDSAEHYASFNYDASVYNWKFALVNNLRYVSIYLVYIVVVATFVMSPFSDAVPLQHKKMLMITSMIILLATIFLLNPSKETGAMYIIGYRYLYITIIPLTVFFAYVIQFNTCKKWIVRLLILLSLAYQEGYVIGKIISFH